MLDTAGKKLKIWDERFSYRVMNNKATSDFVNSQRTNYKTLDIISTVKVLEIFNIQLWEVAGPITHVKDINWLQ